MDVDSQFRNHLFSHSQKTGFCCPDLLMEYLVSLLSSRIRDCDIIPEPSFAERYLQLYSTRNWADIRQFGDQCLFFTSLLPEYGRRRGLDLDYYAALGISSYYAYGDLTKDSRFTQLGNWFYHLQKFLTSALHHEQALELVNLN
jgi:hypothetical protein